MHALTAAACAALAMPAVARAQADIADPPAARRDRDPAGLMDRAAQSGAQVYVDDSFASVEKLRTAQRYASQGQSQLAINEFQNIITNYGQKLVYLNDNSYVSITDYVRERLLQLPAVKAGMYDQLFGGEAQKAVDAAVRQRDVAGLSRVCDRYFPSAAALEGLSQAAGWYFERGEFAAASRTWQTLLAHPLAGKGRAELLFRAAVAEALARDTEAARQLRGRLEKEFPGATGTVSGKDVLLLGQLDEILAMPAWDGVDLAADEWPAFGGGPSRSRLLDVNATIGARLWSVSIAAAPAEGATTSLDADQQMQVRRLAILRARGGVQQEADGPSLSSFTTLSNGTLFVHTGDRVVAVSANAGTQQWVYPLQAAPRMDPATELMIRNNYGVAVKPSAHDSASVFEDGVFAVLPAAAAGRAGTSSRRIDLDVRSLEGPKRVVAVGRDDGKERWSRAADEIPMDNKGNLTFVGSPTVTRQGVFVMARKASDGAFTQQYLVRLDRETGAVTWVCYLCSTSSGAMYGLPVLGGPVAVPTITDDVVYVCTGQGADCAIDANAGRILWLRINDGGGKERTAGEFYNAVMAASPAWKSNPPVVAGDKVVTCDGGQSLRVYQRWTGKLLASFTALDLDLPKIDILAGVIGSHLIVSGEKSSLAVDLAAVDGKDLKPAWRQDVAAEAGKPQGRPFLAAAAYYVPFEKQLVRIDPATGKSEAWDWPNTEKDTPGKPGNVLVTGEQVVVVNDSEIAGYSKWETARDIRQAKIKANPADPEPYLALAEVSFRTNHQELARETMRKSVELANAADAAGGAAGGRPAGDVLRRLYKTNLTFAEQLLAKGDTELRDLARFYFEQCRNSARDPEQQAEWRLRLAELSQRQKKADEAAELYSAVLADPALRGASYREADVLAGAGTTAEQRLRKLIAEHGPQVYRRFEEAAAALLEKARAGRDLAGLQQVVEGYPNAAAAVAAATDLAAAYQDRKDWENARKILWWLEPRVQGEAQARAMADLVTTSLGLKKYASAAAWAARGQRQFKTAVIARGGADNRVTFADLQKEVAAAGKGDVAGRLPAWLGEPARRPAMDKTPLDEANALAGTLLPPVESSPALRPTDRLLVRSGNTVRIIDPAKRAGGLPAVTLPQATGPVVLLGATGGRAVLLQPNWAVSVNLETGEAVRQPLPAAARNAAAARADLERRQMLQIQMNAGVPGVVGNAVVDGNPVMIGPDGNVVDGDAGPSRSVLTGVGDPDLIRRAALRSLGATSFSSARLLNDALVLISGRQVLAYQAATLKPLWGAAAGVTLPAGDPVTMVGNEDLMVAQVDAADGGSSTFCVIDAATGKMRKQVKFDGGTADWCAVGQDGTLFAVSDGAVAAYDLVGDQAGPLWRRNDLQTKFASASALTLDGLIVIDGTNNVQCLALESGEMRWPAPVRMPLESTVGATGLLRSAVDGDQVIFQSSLGAVAVQSAPSENGQIAWVGNYLVGRPPLQSLQLAEPFLIELAIGQVNNAQRAVSVIIRDRRGGKLDLQQEVKAGGGADSGPPIRAWQVVDGGVAFDTGNGVHLWRNLPPAVAPAEAP
jgi:outer membrane protein assembly factor BamB